jgi:hypothetical protein
MKKLLIPLLLFFNLSCFCNEDSSKIFTYFKLWIININNENIKIYNKEPVSDFYLDSREIYYFFMNAEETDFTELHNFDIMQTYAYGEISTLKAYLNGKYN